MRSGWALEMKGRPVETFGDREGTSRPLIRKEHKERE